MMEAQSWNEEGEPNGGLGKVVGSSWLQFFPFCSWARRLWERPRSGNFSRGSIYLWVSNLDRLRDRYSGALTVRIEAGDLNSLQISSKAPPSEEARDQ